MFIKKWELVALVGAIIVMVLCLVLQPSGYKHDPLEVLEVLVHKIPTNTKPTTTTPKSGIKVNYPGVSYRV